MSEVHQAEIPEVTPVVHLARAPWIGVVREHLPLAMLVAAYAGFAALLGAWKDLPHVYVAVLDPGLLQPVLLIAGLVLLARAVPAVLSVVRRRRTPRQAWLHLRQTVLSAEVAGGAAVVCLLVLPCLTAFTSFKRSVIHLTGMGWDETFAQLDLALHLGRHPWEWLHPLLADPATTRFLDLLYMLWVPLLMVVPLVMAWSGRRRLRMQFLLTVALMYVVLGTVLPFLMPCTDPCFFGVATGLPDPYEPLMRYLYEVHSEAPLMAILAQEGLWADRLTPEWFVFGGVAGMPSIHVAYALCMMLLAWRSAPVLAVAGTLYAILIGLGSVHLGWHYAVDGYVSLVGVPLLWWAAGRFTDWWGVGEGRAEAPEGGLG